jgi:chaperone required for assembly of F1-ATPase
VKRFWQQATAEPVEGGGWGVALDGRPLRTPARARLAVPTEALARAIAGEWAAVEGEVRPAAMPLTGLANAAIDRAGPDLAGQIAAFGESDLLCYRADGPADLVALQAASWDPPLAWARTRFDIGFVLVTGVMHAPQPVATVERLRAAVAALDRFHLAGLHPVVTVSGSLVLGLALHEGALEAEAVWQAGALDALWQAERWGEDELAARERAGRRASLMAGARFLALLDGRTPPPAD